MAEALVAILPDVLEAVRPAAIPPSSYLFIAWVAFRLDFMAGIIFHFIFTFIRLNISKLKIVESFSNKGGVLFVSRNHALHAIAKAQQDVSNVKGKIIT